MAAKSEAKDAVPAAPPERPAVPAAAPPSRFPLKTWIPAAALVLIGGPAASWGVTQFVLLPRLERQLLAPATAPGTAAPASEKKAGGPPNAPPTYIFDSVVVNLAGTMGTRYLKTTFQVSGSDPTLGTVFQENKPRLTDVTLNVLSSLTLADLEEPGSKNVLREKLVNAYNQALGRKIAEQVYFSDFVVQ